MRFLLVPTLLRGNAFLDAPASRPPHNVRAALIVSSGWKSLFATGSEGGDHFLRDAGASWGDENVPCFAVNYLPIFVPRKVSWSLVRECRVGGLNPWRSVLVQSLFMSVPFELVRSPTTPFPEPPQCHSFEDATNWRERWWVGLRARLSGRLFQDKLKWRQHPGIYPPTLRSRTSLCRLSRGGTIPAEKYLLKLDDYHHPRSVLKAFPSRSVGTSVCIRLSARFSSGVNVPWEAKARDLAPWDVALQSVCFRRFELLIVPSIHNKFQSFFFDLAFVRFLRDFFGSETAFEGFQ